MSLHKNTLRDPVRVYTAKGVVMFAPGEVKNLAKNIKGLPAGVVEVKKTKSRAKTKVVSKREPTAAPKPKRTRSTPEQSEV